MVWPIPAAVAALLVQEPPASGPASAGAKPKLPKSFHATAYLWESKPDPVCSFTATGSCEGVAWSLNQDDGKKLYATSFDVKNKYAPKAFFGTAKEWYNMTILTTAKTSYTIMNDLCYVGGAASTPKTYTDFFGWLPLASSRGNATVAGVPCDVWGVKVAGYDLLLAVDAATGTTPVHAQCPREMRIPQ